MQQHRNIEVGGATLECTLYGSGTPVVLLANAGCSTGYFEDLARVLAAGGLQAICVNMRGTGESRGSLDGITVHDLAADVAGVLEAVDCGPAHLVGHAFGNRVARCLAADRPSLVRSVTVLAAGGESSKARFRQGFQSYTRRLNSSEPYVFLTLAEPQSAGDHA